MKKILIIIFPLFIFSGYGQDFYYHIEDYQSGTKLIYSVCDASSVVPGRAGGAVVWDFMSMPITEDKIVKTIVYPDSLTKAEFSAANLMEKSSDGSFTALRIQGGRSYSLGIMNEEAQWRVKYDNPVLLIRRPFAFGDRVLKDFEVKFRYGKRRFKGNGNVKIEADGMGTLRMPDSIYQNVLRVQSRMEQTNSIKKYETTHKTEMITYKWFTRDNKAPVLVMTITKSGDDFNVEMLYLKKEIIGRGRPRTRI